jgi:hypothetical protein
VRYLKLGRVLIKNRTTNGVSRHYLHIHLVRSEYHVTSAYYFYGTIYSCWQEL